MAGGRHLFALYEIGFGGRTVQPSRPCLFLNDTITRPPEDARASSILSVQAEMFLDTPGLEEDLTGGGDKAGTDAARAHR